MYRQNSEKALLGEGPAPSPPPPPLATLVVRGVFVAQNYLGMEQQWYFNHGSLGEGGGVMKLTTQCCRIFKVWTVLFALTVICDVVAFIQAGARNVSPRIPSKWKLCPDRCRDLLFLERSNYNYMIHPYIHNSIVCDSLFQTLLILYDAVTKIYIQINVVNHACRKLYELFETFYNYNPNQF